MWLNYSSVLFKCNLFTSLKTDEGCNCFNTNKQIQSYLLKAEGSAVFLSILLCRICRNISTIVDNSVSDLFVIPRGIVMFELSATIRVNTSAVLGVLFPASSEAIKQLCKCSSKSTSRMQSY